MLQIKKKVLSIMHPWCVWPEIKWYNVRMHAPSVRCMSEFQATEPHHGCLQSSAHYGINIMLLQTAFSFFDTPLNRSNYRSFPRHLLLSRGNLILKQGNFCAKVMPEHKQTAKRPITFACQGNLSNTVHRQLPETRKKPLVRSCSGLLR